MKINQKKRKSVFWQISSDAEHFFPGGFPGKDGGIKKTDQAEHLIDTVYTQPFQSAQYRVSRYAREIIVYEVAKIMRAGMIRPSPSPWVASVVLVKKMEVIVFYKL